MSVNVVSFFRSASRPRDWNNQELAEFYRVEASLIRSGLSVVTDRGLSDEGDPWFVFCRTDTEDVIIHFARIDGCYVVASPAFDDCVRGHEFRKLIERLIDSHPLVVPKSRDGKKILIHPAALLVALVTTCFFKFGQSEASAAEIKGTKLTVSTSGSSDYKETARGTSPVFLSEQAANIALAIIASAASWTPTDVFNIDAPTVQHSSAEEQSLITDTTSTLSFPLENITGTSAHAMNVLGADAPVVTVSVFITPRLHANDGVSALQTTPENDAVRIVLHTPAPVHDVQAPIQALSDHTQAAHIPRPIETYAAISLAHDGSSANQEVVSILGDALRAHLLYGQTSTEQALIVTSSGSKGTSQLVKQVANEGAQTSSPSAAIIASKAEVDQAIQKFVVSHPDFLLFTIKNEIILFDSHLTTGNMSSAEHQEFSYVDGSTIFLIGLPAPGSLGNVLI